MIVDHSRPFAQGQIGQPGAPGKGGGSDLGYRRQFQELQGCAVLERMVANGDSQGQIYRLQCRTIGKAVGADLGHSRQADAFQPGAAYKGIRVNIGQTVRCRYLLQGGDSGKDIAQVLHAI